MTWALVTSRLDALSEGIRPLVSGSDTQAGYPWAPAEIVRATATAAGRLAELHTILGREFGDRLDPDVLVSWRDAVQHLRAVEDRLTAVPGELR